LRGAQLAEVLGGSKIVEGVLFMGRMKNTLLNLSLFLAITAFQNPLHAQSKQPPQAKPWLLAIVDTSTTMGPATVPPALTAPNLGPNSCGFTQNPTTRITHAKCALNRVINATGDAVFGLMQFAQTGCKTGGPCNDTAASGQMLVNVADNNQRQILSFVDDVGTCVGQELVPGDLTNITYTPLPGALALARNYFSGTAPSPFNVSPTGNDSYAECRPMAVILLTDGIEQCSYTAGQVGVGAVVRATELRSTAIPVLASVNASGIITKDIRTYVIGFGITPGDASIEAIANAGGTDAPGDHLGFYPTNEAGLSLAFTQIIADAQLSPELCNNKDDNCNGLIDEGIVKYCDKPQGINDLSLCDEPPETVCDGIDDNCDGQTDEGLFNACGVCGPVPEETCDAIDNDCDGQVDEGLDDKTECGVSIGECKPGKLRCIKGQFVCMGETGPGKEVCDCKDNDCDGLIDEDTEGGLCPGETVCFQCECEELCTPGIEFKGCDVGKREVEDENGRCICIADVCDPTKCASKTLRKNNQIICAPDDEKIGPCKCYKGDCVDQCEGVKCQSGEVCVPQNGRCLPNRCEYLGCETDQRCNSLTGQCEADPCVTADCTSEQMCRDGLCEESCAEKDCAKGTLCKSGKCVADNCSGVSCKSGTICNPDTGKCITNACLKSNCPTTLDCDVMTGECMASGCSVVRCPEGQSCTKGECVLSSKLPKDAGNSTTRADGGQQFTSGGGGGCSCAITGTSTQRERSGRWWLMGLGLCALGLSRRSRRSSNQKHFRVNVTSLYAFILAVCMAMTVSGCKVKTACLENCGVDADIKKTDAKAGDSKEDDDASSGEGKLIEGDASVQPKSDASEDTVSKKDSGLTDLCKYPREEVCNLRDDDCDGTTDEDLSVPAGYCGTSGVCATVVAKCGPAGSWVCDFPSTYQAIETACDGLDNDCDGLIDEPFPNLGTLCSAGNGICHREGFMICNSAGDGTECTIKSGGTPAEEICDGIDNDCDGLIDESKSDPGSNPGYVVDTMVNVGTIWVYAYEASRTDATNSAQGASNVRPCSRAGVLPWTNITHAEAENACQSIGLRLCTESEWQQACQGSTGKCNWSYSPSAATGGTCNDYETQATSTTAPHSGCNGKEYVYDPANPGEWLMPSGKLSECYADFGAGGKVYDLSGNVKEWTAAREAGVNPLRGGSMNNIAGGLKCNFNFSVADDSFSFQNVGFRCCADASYVP
jgi:hypothetical protein